MYACMCYWVEVKDTSWGSKVVFFLFVVQLGQVGDLIWSDLNRQKLGKAGTEIPIRKAVTLKLLIQKLSVSQM